MIEKRERLDSRGSVVDGSVEKVLCKFAEFAMLSELNLEKPDKKAQLSLLKSQPFIVKLLVIFLVKLKAAGSMISEVERNGHVRTRDSIRRFPMTFAITPLSFTLGVKVSFPKYRVCTSFIITLTVERSTRLHSTSGPFIVNWSYTQVHDRKHSSQRPVAEPVISTIT